MSKSSLLKPLIPTSKTITNTTLLSQTLQFYINSNTPLHGQHIQAHILKTGYKPNTNISIKLLILHSKCSCLVYAHQEFDETPQWTLTAFNYMIAGYTKNGDVGQFLKLFRRLVLCGERSDGYTFSMVLKALSCGNWCRIGKEVHGQIVKSCVVVDDVLATALVDLYVKSGRVGYARRVFDFMMDKDVVCSTSMISGNMREGCVEDAEEVFEKTGEKDVVVFNAMIEGYSKLVETAKKAVEVYISMQRLDFKPNMLDWQPLNS